MFLFLSVRWNKWVDLYKVRPYEINKFQTKQRNYSNLCVVLKFIFSELGWCILTLGILDFNCPSSIKRYNLLDKQFLIRNKLSTNKHVINKSSRLVYSLNPPSFLFKAPFPSWNALVNLRRLIYFIFPVDVIPPSFQMV